MGMTVGSSPVYWQKLMQGCQPLMWLWLWLSPVQQSNTDLVGFVGAVFDERHPFVVQLDWRWLRHHSRCMWVQSRGLKSCILLLGLSARN